MTIRRVDQVHVMSLDHPMEGFDTRNIGPTNLGRKMDPFVNLDDFSMDRPIFRAHPHAGFSAVTYTFEDSAGTFRNRWSFGDPQLIGPGAVHWTQAGAGMIHEEIPVESGLQCHGVQMFVKLPSSAELSSPAAFHLDADEIPEVTVNGARVRVLAGTWGGVTSPMAIANELVWLDVQLEAGGRFETSAPAAHSAFAMTIHGSVTVDDQALPEHCGFAFDNGGDRVVIDSPTGAQFLWCSGQPIGEPIVANGPFMMSTQERLVSAFERYREGEMGELVSSF